MLLSPNHEVQSPSNLFPMPPMAPDVHPLATELRHQMELQLERDPRTNGGLFLSMLVLRATVNQLDPPEAAIKDAEIVLGWCMPEGLQTEPPIQERPTDPMLDTIDQDRASIAAALNAYDEGPTSRMVRMARAGLRRRR